MIKIFNSNDKNFSSMGDMVIEPISCIETKKKSLNGWYIKCEIPIKYKDYISKDKLIVIKTKSKLSPQAFSIDDIEFTTNTMIITANHIAFRAEDYFLLDVRPTNLSVNATLNYINERTDNESPYNTYSDLTNVSTSYFIRKSLLEAWSILQEKVGGEFDIDNFNISLLSHVGNDNGEVISYGNNLESFNVFEDWSAVCTKLYPVGKDGLMLPEKFIESDVQYEKPYTRTIHFESELEEDEQSEENLIVELRNNANRYLAISKYPRVTYEIQSNINQDLEVGDIIHVKHPIINLNTEVLEYEFDHCKNKITKLVFGNYVRDVKSKFNSIKEEISTLIEKVSAQDEAIAIQTAIINNLGKYGKVIQTDNEILILDAVPKENAKNVWRWNLGGFGFSPNGYEGPFTLALTTDGRINADFITTGKINTSLIEGYDQLVSNVSSLDDSLKQTNQLVQDAINGLENTLTTSGGNNIFKNTDLVETDGNNYSYWSGIANKKSNPDAVNGISILLQNGSFKQIVSVPNGQYVIGFFYEQLINNSIASFKVNGISISLEEASLFETVISVDTNSIEIEFICDTNNGYQIYDLRGNVGTVLLPYSQNENETRSDTVTIGKGITIKSDTSNTIRKIDADGDRTYNASTNELVREDTDEGSTLKKIIVKEDSKITGLTFTRIDNNRTWISGV